MPSTLHKYWRVFKIGLLDILEYKFDFFLTSFKYALMVLLMAVIWTSIQRSGATGFSVEQIVQYFFISAILYSLSNFHTYYVEEDIRLGYLGKFLTRPIKPFWYYFNYQVSHSGSEALIKALVCIPLLGILGYSLSPHLADILLFIIFLPVSFFFAFNYLFIISSLSFWLTEAWALRWAATSIARFLSGILVPIAFLPEWYQHISFFLPFQHIAYTPIQIIQHQVSSSQALYSLGILLTWTIGISFLRSFIWKRGILGYENTGI